MHMSLAQGWTVERVRALPDNGNLYEVIDGELCVTPGPSYDHQSAARAVGQRLVPCVEPQGLGYVFLSPIDVEFGPRTMVAPDVAVVPLVNGRRPRHWREAGRRLLAVEILSPGTAARDRGVKRRLYHREEVPEYWIVDLDTRLIERWRPGDVRPEVAQAEMVWTPAGGAAAHTIDVAALFASVLDQ